jgi:DNA modification methylase
VKNFAIFMLKVLGAIDDFIFYCLGVALDFLAEWLSWTQKWIERGVWLGIVLFDIYIGILDHRSTFGWWFSAFAYLGFALWIARSDAERQRRRDSISMMCFRLVFVALTACQLGLLVFEHPGLRFAGVDIFFILLLYLVATPHGKNRKKGKRRKAALTKIIQMFGTSWIPQAGGCMNHFRLKFGDCRDVLKTLSDDFVHSVVCDPPYELGFLGTSWDRTGIAYDINMWREVLRVLKPGGHLLAFGGSRTYHRMACAVEDAGFEIRNQLQWLCASGFPKSLDVSKAMNKAAGVEREIAVKQWEGWGTALKPAHEPIVVARKPLIGTVVQNVLEHGTGAINIKACRVGTEPVPSNKLEQWSGFGQLERPAYTQTMNEGRWPANVIHDGSDEVLEAFAVAGERTSGKPGKRSRVAISGSMAGDLGVIDRIEPGYSDSGSVARFFYCAKANKKEREAGLENFAAAFATRDNGFSDKLSDTKLPRANNHPTVKPLALMRYLVRLVTPPKGIVLDPFTGSGTTGVAALREGFNFMGVEMDQHYLDIAKARIDHVRQKIAEGK